MQKFLLLCTFATVVLFSCVACAQNNCVYFYDGISVDAAWSATKKELAVLPGWSEAMVELFEVTLQVHYTPVDAQKSA